MYINSIDMDVETRCTILQYLRVISKRASGKKSFLLPLLLAPPPLLSSSLFPCFLPQSLPPSHLPSLPSLPPSPPYYSTGELMTTAGWVRKQVLTHPDYKQDSVVNDKVTFDLIQRMKEVTEGSVPCPDLLGSLASKAPKTYTVLECTPSNPNLGN